MNRVMHGIDTGWAASGPILVWSGGGEVANSEGTDGFTTRKSCV